MLFFMQTLFDKEKIEWLHSLLKQDAPEIYQRYMALKARKETESTYAKKETPPPKPMEMKNKEDALRVGGDDFIEGLEKDKEMV